MQLLSGFPAWLHPSFVVVFALLTAHLISALPHTLDSRELEVQVVHSFPPGTWVENLAFRQSRDTVIATILTPLPQVYEVDPHTSQASLLHQFSGVTSLAGIAKLDQDVFYVIAGNFSFKSFSATPGSYSVWEVDLRAKTPAVSLVAPLPQAAFLNGMTALNEDVLLAADSSLGAVWSLNVNTKVVALAVEDPTMGKGDGPIGINGIKVRGGYLFYTNTASESFFKIPIDCSVGTATGPAVLIASGVPGDDFTFDKQGNAWVAADSNAELVLLPTAATAAPGIGGPGGRGRVGEFHCARRSDCGRVWVW